MSFIFTEKLVPVDGSAPCGRAHIGDTYAGIRRNLDGNSQHVDFVASETSGKMLKLAGKCSCVSV